MNSARSLRLVFATIGSRGDVQPIVALALAAAARGHRPLVAAPVNFKAWVEGKGLEFAPFGMDVQQYLAENPDTLSSGALATAREMRRLVRENTPGDVKALCSAVEGADGIVWGGIAFSAPSVAEWKRIPNLGIAFTTQVFPSRQHPPIIVPWPSAPPWLNRIIWPAYSFFAEHGLGTFLHPVRDSLGLPRVRVLKHIREDQTIAIAADEGLLPDDPAWGGRYPRAGFIHYDDPRDLDPDLERWLGEGEPPIYAGFGSMNGPGPRRAAQAFIEALAGSGRRCIIGSGWAGLGGGDLPAGWRVVGDAPHAKLFPRMSLVIHHGGSGTTAAALRAGTRQIVLPLLMDQFLHGHRLHERGLAPRPVPMTKITGPVLAQRITEALALPDGPRQAAAQRIRSSDAIGKILGMAESMCA